MGAVRFGRYQLLRRLGAGAVGEVLLATDGRRRFAIKRLLPHAIGTAAAASFAREAAIASRLRHPNIVAVLDHGVIDGVPYLLMEYVDGVTLHRLLRSLDDRPPALGAFVVRELCRALACVHCATDADGQPLALVHRDVSPANVLVGRDGSVKLCDFGIARSTKIAVDTQSGIKGKLEYLSPEQANNEPLDGRSDLFSAGTILYEALTGRCPFEEDTDATVIARVRAAVVERASRHAPSLPPELDVICARALARDRRDRFATADDMATALDRVLDAHPFDAAALARRVPRPPASVEPTERTRTLVARPLRRPVALVAGAVSLVALGWLAWRVRAPSTPPPTTLAAPLTTLAAPPPTVAPAPPTAEPATVRRASSPDPEPSLVDTKSASPDRARDRTVLPSHRRRPASSQPNGRPRGRDFMPDPFAGKSSPAGRRSD